MTSDAIFRIRERLVTFFGCRTAPVLGCFWRCILEFALMLWIVRAPFGSVLLGFFLLGATPQAQDLLIPLVDSPPYYILLFFFLHFLFWAMPVHYSARILLDDDARLFKYGRQNPSPYLVWIERWIPRLLGATTFIALIMSAYRANINLPQLASQDQGVVDSLTHNLRYFMLWCVVGLIVFLYYTIYRTDLVTWTGRGWMDKFTAFGRPVLHVLDIGGRNSAKQLTKDDSRLNEFGQLVLLIVFIVFVVVLMLQPNQVASLLPGAFAVSLILGGWLPILTYLSAIGRRIRAPLIVAAICGIALITSIVGDNHDVRPIAGAATQGPIRLNQALEIWTAANGCSKDDVKSCPRPIIIAASGGASRAGFFTASVLGQLLDKAPAHGFDPTKVRNRLFAISSVSGSSVAAVMTVAAFAAGAQNTIVPCRRDKFSDWYGDVIKNWRGCLESLMAGDFLTPTFIGLMFHDMIPFGFWPDRATILEQSWERLFAKAMDGGAATHGTKLPCPAELDCPFFSLRPTTDLWLPLLILNGVSVTTGQRIVTTTLAPRYSASAACPTDGLANDCPLFAETWFFHELLTDTTKASGWRSQLQHVMTVDYMASRNPNDVRLSTAAHNSARFPIISPPGNIRNRDHYVLDRIVDGGYMENFGVLAAFELAEAVQAVQPNLKPFLLVISNDPEEPVGMQLSPDDVGATSYFTDLTSLVTAVANTRDARGSLAVAQLSSLLRDLVGPQCKVSFAHIRVWPERADPKNKQCSGNFSQRPRAVSMSWWLSTPVQYRLFDEIEGTKTCNQDALTSTWQAMRMNSDCTEN